MNQEHDHMYSKTMIVKRADISLHVAISFVLSYVHPLISKNAHRTYTYNKKLDDVRFMYENFIDLIEFLCGVELTFRSHHVRKEERLSARS